MVQNRGFGLFSLLLVPYSGHLIPKCPRTVFKALVLTLVRTVVRIYDVGTVYRGTGRGPLDGSRPEKMVIFKMVDGLSSLRSRTLSARPNDQIDYKLINCGHPWVTNWISFDSYVSKMVKIDKMVNFVTHIWLKVMNLSILTYTREN